jgi:hypothetical protein
MDPIKFKQSLSVGEFLKVLLAMFFKSKRNRILFLFCIGMFNILLFKSNTPLNFVNIILFNLAAIIIIFIAMLIYISIIGVVVYIIKGESISNTFFQFDHWGMVKSVPDKQYELYWRNIKKIEETKSYYFIYSKLTYLKGKHIVLKKYVKTTEDAERLHQFINERSN